MTCILGYTDGKEAHIASDSLGSNGHQKLIRSDEKLFQVGKFIIGCTTSFRMIQLLRYGSKHKNKKYSLAQLDYKNKNLDEFMATEFVDKCRDILKHGGFLDEKSPISGGVFLVGLKGGYLCKVEADFQIARSFDGFESCGCGDIAALGAIRAIKRVNGKINPKNDLVTAIEITSSMIEGVGGPTNILNI